MAKDKDPKERDWDREMREVDKLLAKLPEADPTLGRGVPTVPVSPHPGSPEWRARAPSIPRSRAGARVASHLAPRGARCRLGIGNARLALHTPADSSWSSILLARRRSPSPALERVDVVKRRLGIAHTLSILLDDLGLALAGRQLLPRCTVRLLFHFFCPNVKAWTSRTSSPALGRSLDGRVLRELQPGGLETM